MKKIFGIDFHGLWTMVYGLRKSRGFTMIEAIMLMAILVIVAVVVSPQTNSLQPTRVSYAAKRLQTDIRYAQALAMQTQLRTQVIVNVAGNSYTLQIEDPATVWTTIVRPVSNDAYAIQLGGGDYQGVAISASNFNGQPSLMFDINGRPYDQAGTVLSTNGTISLNAPNQVVIAPRTGWTRVEAL